jgi:phosphatidate cytidylyltransferase
MLNRNRPQRSALAVSHRSVWPTIALLIVASVIGCILRARVKDEKAAAVVDNLIARVRAWWWMVGVFAAAFLLGRNATIAMFAFISFFALREFLTLTPTKIGDHRALSVAFFIVIPIQYLLIATSWYGLFSIFIPVYGFLFLPSISVLAHDTESFLERSAKIQWGLMITVYCISHVPALLLANSRLRGRESAADVLSSPRRADERRAAICLRQAVR